MGATSPLNNVRQSLLTGTNGGQGTVNALNENTVGTLKEGEALAAEQSGVSSAMNKLTQAINANQLAHGINKSIISNTKTIAQQYLSIA